MGKQHCICKKEPCECHNGWGTHFKTEDELLRTISAEIRSQTQEARESDIVVARWMVEDLDATEEEIAEALGVSQRGARRLMRTVGSKRV